MRRGERIVLRAGLALCVVGALLVAFVAYQLWGTALYAHQAQSHLRSELATQLRRPLPASAAAGNGTHDHAGTGLPPPAAAPARSEPDPPTGSPVGLLSIPAIDVDFAVVEGVGAAQLEQGPGHYPGTPLPGERGNVAIAGHRTTYAHPFYDLNLLHPGDHVYLLTSQGLFRYAVVRSQVVSPTDVRVLTSPSSEPTLTLTTCNPRYSAATRLVVTADFDPGPATRSATAGSTTASAPGRGTPAATSGPATAGGGASESYWPGVLWGLATLAAVVALRVVWRRLPRRLRWLPVVVGVPVVAGGLLVCFEHVSLALPASF